MTLLLLLTNYALPTSLEEYAVLPSRRPSYGVLIDWDLDYDFDNETNYVLALEGERMITEPLGGIHQAQADVRISNASGRFTPNSASIIAEYLKINRRIKINTGFYSRQTLFLNGVTEFPEIDEQKKTVKIHAWDFMEDLRNFKLSSGSELFEGIRTDRYIWNILDQVYEDFFTVIASFDTDETISGTNHTADTTNHRGGDRAYKISATAGGQANVYKNVTLSLGNYSDQDKICLFLYVEDMDNVDTITLRLHSTVNTNYKDYALTNYVLVSGWNEIAIEKDDGAITGSYNPNAIVRAEIILDAVAGQDVYCIVDELRIINRQKYPLRYFDTGLQDIPVATYSGNSAMTEIKAACEAEGARAYFDEDGNFRFENRQHYNNNADHKVSVVELADDRIIQRKYPEPEQGIINSVSLTINPRVIQAEKEIWRYGEVVQIAAGATLTLWASFTDPVPVTASGLVTPASTTDYTANDNADGSGTNRTASISIVTTKFTDAAKLEITNNHSGAVYLTLMKLRGTPAEQQGATFIKSIDQASIDTYGELKYEAELKYLASASYAQTLADQLIDWYANPLDKPVITHPALPFLKLGDMISLANEETEEVDIMRVMGYSMSMQKNQLFKQTTYLRSVTAFEQLTFFEIGASSIGGTDVISS